MARINIDLQIETDALVHQITRLTALHDRVRGLLEEASAACAILDTFGATYTELLAPIRPLIITARGALPAIVECEERAVEFDGALERLMKIACTENIFFELIFASQELRRKPLPLATAILKKLANLFPIAHAIAHCPADLQPCLEKALEKKDMLGLALLLKDGRVDLEKHGLRILIAAAQTGHTDILVQLKKYFTLPSNTREAAEILLLEPKELRQAAFEKHVHALWYWDVYGGELATQIKHIVALLASTLVSPGANSDELLWIFVRSQNASAVRTLLADPRLDPSDAKMLSVIEMAHNIGGSAELTHLLVSYAGTRPAIDRAEVLYAATLCKDVLNIQALLADPSVLFTEERLFGQAIRTGSVDVVSLFLLDGRVNPAAHGNYALTLARRIDNKPLVALLLSNERVQKSL